MSIQLLHAQPQARNYIAEHLEPILMMARHIAEAIDIALSEEEKPLDDGIWKHLQRLLQSQLRACREYLAVLQEIEFSWLHGKPLLSWALKKTLCQHEQEIHQLVYQKKACDIQKTELRSLNWRLMADFQQAYPDAKGREEEVGR